MMFSLEAGFESVGEGMRRLRPALESLRATGKVVGPLAELRGLKGGNEQSILAILPDVADYEAVIAGEAPVVALSRDDTLVPNTSYDSVATYLGDWGAVILECETPRYASRIRIDFTAPRNPRDADRAIPLHRLLGTDARRRVLDTVISACLMRGAPSSLVRELMLSSGATHGFRPFRDETGLLECEILVRDDSSGINHAVAVRPLKADILNAYAAAVGALQEANGWRMTLYGNKDRMQVLLEGWGERGVSLSFGNTIARANELLDLERRDREAWRVEVQGSILSDAALRELLRREDEPELYERLGIRWMGLGNVLGSDADAGSATGLEIVRVKGRSAQVYVFVGDELASRSTKKTLESWIGGRLRTVDL